METLVGEIKQCTVCKEHLPLGAKPILIANSETKIALISQTPGRIAHNSGIPWDDPGGKQLKKWLNVTEEQFYNPLNFAVIPMGFCYPGKGKSGDLPPRPECAPLWHTLLLNRMPSLKLIILIGMHSQKYYLKKKTKKTLTETVKAYQEYLPKYFPIPHPSPRNRFWLLKNPWFEDEIVSMLQQEVKKLIM